MGKNGGCRYQSRARKLHARRNKSTASRGRTSARSAKRRYSADQLAIRRIPSVYSRPMTLASSVTPRALGLARYRGEFPIFRDRVYLNTCSLGALGERARRKVAEFLDYRRRPKVVITSLDFPTVAYQWLAKVPGGVELVVVESPDTISVPVDAIARAVDDRTALVVTSHVYFTTGAIQDIKRVAQVAHAHGALCLIDAYQSVGQIPVDVKDAEVDALVAGGLKWLLGGPGIVFLYVREGVARRLEPRISGWFGQREQFAFDPRALTFHNDARRFELGTPSLAAVYAQLGGLEYIEEIGISTIREATAALTEDLIATVRAAGFKPKVAAEPERRSAIVMIPMPDPAASVRHLAAGGVIADSRPGHVRFSPFFYNVQVDYVRAIERLASQPAH